MRCVIYESRRTCNMTSALSKHAHMCPLRKVTAVHSLPDVADFINTKHLALGQQTEHFSARLVPDNCILQGVKE
jgi:hypothetical protein